MITASVIRIPLSLSVIWAVHTTVTRPQPPPQPEERVGPVGFEVSLLPMLLKILSWTPGLAEILVILGRLYPSTLSRYITTILIQPPAAPDDIRLTTTSVVAWGCIIAGVMGRRSCYRSMQEMFTFELSLRKNHRLVTSGLYSIVRHPSYTCAGLTLFGALTYYMTRGSWFAECSGFIPHSKSGLFLAISWLFCFAASVLVVGTRVEKEDSMLKEHFGLEWETWAMKVPYRLIPGIY